ncbi:MAG: 3-dehydroquinate synthase [Bdellovibrionales bacterium]|nr:3-dehydroquinate synthase [Bdellovibrionales bacterium]
MELNFNKINVNVPGNNYEIQISAGGLESCLELILKTHSPDRLIVITDTNVAPLYLKYFPEQSSLPMHVITVPAGEATKSFDNFQNICEDILRFGVTRKSVLVALGGGVVGDLVGFVASTLLRGLRFVQVPTTLLAQVDSSVGGKTAINSKYGKNLVGAFHQPSLVIIDVLTCHTLAEADFIDGYAEILKYALIDDGDFFIWLNENLQAIQKRDPQFLQEAVHISCLKKVKYVEADEREQNVRALLNFGHTFGHAIESLSNFSISHGASVAIGMCMASEFSFSLGLVGEDVHRKILDHVGRARLPTRCAFSIQQMLPFMRKDKKVVSSDGLTLILLEDLGRAVVRSRLPEESLVRHFGSSDSQTSPLPQ